MLFDSAFGIKGKRFKILRFWIEIFSKKFWQKISDPISFCIKSLKVKIGMNIISVTVGPDQLDKTRGLCGTFNGKANDDFTDTKGRQAVRADLFATSWKVSETCLEPVMSLNRGQCASNPEMEEKARRRCQLIFMKPFRLKLPLSISSQRIFEKTRK